MLITILSNRSTGDAQAPIGAFERCFREYEARAHTHTHTVPDFVKAGIVVKGIKERALRHQLVIHNARLDSYEKLKQEVFDIARAKSALGAASTSSPVEFDDHRRDKWQRQGQG